MLICFSFFFFLITPSMGLSVLLVFSENQLLALLIIIVCLCSITLISALYYFFSSTCLGIICYSPFILRPTLVWHPTILLHWNGWSWWLSCFPVQWTLIWTHVILALKSICIIPARDILFGFHAIILSYLLSYCSSFFFLFWSPFYLTSKYWVDLGLVSSVSTPGTANSDAYKVQTGNVNGQCRVIVCIFECIGVFFNFIKKYAPSLFSLNTRPLWSIFHFPSFIETWILRNISLLEKQWFTNTMINGKWQLASVLRRHYGELENSCLI